MLRYYRYECVQDLAEMWRPGLEGFESWAIFDGSYNHVEYPAGGPLSHFLENWGGTPCQVYMISSSANAVSAVRESTASLNAPVFHFEDGQVLFVHPSQPAQTLARRCEREFAKLDGWSIYDEHGGCASAGGGADQMWQPIDLGRVTFSDW
ncbi:MAG: hypothetical protein AB7M05_13960 [Alphaproteobacteria bacterium]